MNQKRKQPANRKILAEKRKTFCCVQRASVSCLHELFRAWLPLTLFGRLFAQNESSVTLQLLEQAALALGRKLKIELA